MTSVEQQNLCRVSCTGGEAGGGAEANVAMEHGGQQHLALRHHHTGHCAVDAEIVCRQGQSSLGVVVVYKMIKYFYNDTIHWRFERVCVNGKMNAINKVHSWWFEETLSIRDQGA